MAVDPRIEAIAAIMIAGAITLLTLVRYRKYSSDIGTTAMNGMVSMSSNNDGAGNVSRSQVRG